MSIDALQDCLAAEHAAVYGYGVLGGVLADATAAGSPDQTLAASAYVEHRTRRDELTELIRQVGAAPVAADPAYQLPGPVKDAEDCRALARRLEDRCAQTYADAVSRSEDADRELTARALMASALRSAAWGSEPEAFPGISEF